MRRAALRGGRRRPLPFLAGSGVRGRARTRPATRPSASPTPTSSSPAGSWCRTGSSSRPTTPATPAASSPSTPGTGSTVGVTSLAVGPRWTSRRSRPPGRGTSGSATSATTGPSATRSRCSGCRSAAGTSRPRRRRTSSSTPTAPRDAEALVRHPLTGQLFVITKGIFGGTVYAAPRAAAGRPAQPPGGGRRGAGHRHRRDLPAGRRRGRDADLLRGVRRRLPVVAARHVVGAARAGPGRGHRGRPGRPAAQHRGRAVAGAVGAAARRGGRDRPARHGLDRPALARDRRVACRSRRARRRARPARGAWCRGRPAARRRPA